MKLNYGWALGLLLVSSVATAGPGDARCTVKVINALPGKGGIDPRITRLRPRLMQPPFNNWQTFKLLVEKEAELKPGGSTTLALPNGREAEVTYTEHEAPGKTHRVRGVFKINHAKSVSKTNFVLDEGGLFLVAGEAFDGGILIYSLSCRTEN